ncbi:polysaccharide biosynthesis tyrosine autokinase [Candidatus Saccharibacteria bacterium]|nr:polysaccharide biosynthesis tyrosine autokinase [Candidatus Saccharibacteria bacterium]
MEELDIKDFLSYLKKYIILIFVVPILVIITTFFYDSKIKQPLYKATTKIALIQSGANNTSSAATLNEINANQKLISTYGVIAKSKLVLEPVIEKLNLETTPEELAKNVKVNDIEETTILEISVTDKGSTLASDIANTIAEVFTNDIDLIKDYNNVAIIERAEAPTMPSNNTLKRDLALALVLSLFGIVGILFVIYYFDDTIKYNENLENAIGLPIIGKIAKGEIESGPRGTELVVEKFPKAVVSESIRSLRTNLQFTSIDHNLQTIHVTSSAAGEGKSFISSNLAASFAQAGKKTLLVDCDLRKGRQHTIFKKSNAKGLSNLLADSTLAPSTYIQKTNIKNLYLLTRGTSTPNPSELLSSRKNKTLISKLKKEYDIIIFDSAPCNAITDPVIMSTLVDETIIVSKNGKTPRSLLASTKDALTKVDAKVAGVVINQIAKTEGYYHSYYGGYYGDSTSSKAKGKSTK